MSNPQVELHVTINVADTATQGVITLELDAVNAPKSTENFLNYVNAGFYNGTVFHRVIKNFMIQGGGMTPDMKQKETQAPIENEAKNGLKNDKYTVAMARTSDPHSATAQFFINVVDNGFLNHTSPTPKAGATPCSARWSRAKTSSTPSRRCAPPARASMTTCRSTPWSSTRPLPSKLLVWPRS